MTFIPAERRVHPRYPLGATVIYSYGGQIYPGNVQDLGKGGISFWGEIDMPVGESLTLTLTLIVGTAQARLTCRGVVRWKQAPQPGLFRYGAAFGSLNDAQTAVLAEFLGGTGAPPVRETA